MLSVRGYSKDNCFIPIENITIPDGKQVIVTILEETAAIPEYERQRKIFAEASAMLKANPEKLPPAFDDIISEGVKFREFDWS